jgi:uncharacterized repeat protein (TIGR01451 family)
MGPTFSTSTSTLSRIPLRAIFTLLVALSLVATQLAALGAQPARAAEVWDLLPWTIDGAYDADEAPTPLTDICGNGVKDDATINGASYKLNTINLQQAPVFTDSANTRKMSDLCNVWLDLDVQDDDVFLYFAWERFAPNGSAVVHLELQQGELVGACAADEPEFFKTGGCNPFANRGDGDLLLSYDFTGSSAKITTRYWDADAKAFGPIDDVAPDFYRAAMNGGANTATFGEAAINLTDAGVLPSAATEDECVTFALVLPFTQTGNSDDAELIDTVLNGFPGPVISNCGSLQVKKVTDPTNVPGSFPITVWGGPKALPLEASPLKATLVNHGGTATFHDLLAGTTYRLDEQVPTGWDLTSISCSVDGGPAVDALDKNLTIQVTKTTVCTITNTAQLPKVTLNKTVVNDWGGTATAADFTPRFGGQDRAWGQQFTILPGNYTASELMNVSNYVADPWGGHCAANGSITVGLGQTYTCSVTNRDQPAKLTLEKTVVNNHGGTKTKADFTPRIGGSKKSWDTTYDLSAGDHTISEDDVAGYSSGDWGGACLADGSLKLAMGQTAKCTITNFDVAPGLTVLKSVQNNHGGDAKPEDFQLYISHAEPGEELEAAPDPSDLTSAALAVEDGPDAEPTKVTEDGEEAEETDDGDLVEEALVANDDASALGAPSTSSTPVTRSIKHGDSPAVEAYVEYTLSEDLLPGYELVGIACVDEDTKASVSHPVTLTEGQAVTCTITNRDKQPTLTLTKVVTNDDGGELGVADFPLTYNGVSATSGVPNNVMANQVYTVTEEQQAGYELTKIDCDAKGSTTEADSLDVSLAPGENLTCTFYNDDIAPEITVVKNVVGGTAAPDDFALTLNGAPVLSGSTTKATAGETYTVGETLVANYLQTGLSCVETGTTTAVTHPVVPTLAQAVTCTITNTYSPPPPPPPVLTPGLGLEKAVSIAGGPWLDADTAPGPTAIVGQNVRFRFTVTNTGSTTLSPISLSDNTYSTTSCTWPASLAPGASTRCIIGPFAATAGQHTNIATVIAGGLTVTDPANYFGEGPGIQVVKTANTDVAEVGDEVTYTYVVTNTGNVTLTGVTLDDDIIGTITLPAAGLTLDPGESTTVTATYTITEEDAADGGVTNVATASGQPPTGPRVTDTDEVTVGVVAVLPGVLDIDIEKVAQVPLDAEGNKVVTYKAGETTTVEYLYTVTNTGTVTLVNVAVEDDILGPVTLLKTTLEPGESTTGTATHVVTAADADEGEIVNVAVVTSMTEDGGPGPRADVTETVGVAKVLDVVIAQPPAPALPRTGADAHLLFNLGLLMAATGAAALLFTPRRRREQ